jgi:type I restriction enzyme S subunit
MNWRSFRLGEIAVEDRKIITPDSSEATLRPYLGLEQIESGTGRILSYDDNSAEGKSTTFAFDESHVLYGKLRPYLNKVAAPERKGRCSTEIIPLLPQGVDREFLAFFLRTELVVNAAMSEKTGSRMPRADMGMLLSLEISIPETISAQRQIAARLKAQLAEVDKARQAAETQLRDADLLGHRIFNKIWAELDSVPRKPLGEYAQTTSGSTPARGNKQYWRPAEIAWVKTAEVAFAPITKTEEAISQKALAECSLTLLPPKTVLIAMYGQGKTRGQSAILEIPATTNQACFAILPNDAWEPKFLFHWLEFSYQDLRTLSEGRGGNQANLNGGLLKALQIPMPDKATQKAIIARIENALTEIETVKNGSKAMLNDINLMPQKILAQAFEM